MQTAASCREMQMSEGENEMKMSNVAYASGHNRHFGKKNTELLKNALYSAVKL